MLVDQQLSTGHRRKNSQILRSASQIVCWLVPLLALIVALSRLHLGWDDGAITAAFARTFLQSGKMALTPHSVQVEGFSSLLWMLVLSAGDIVFRSEGGMLAWTKIASAIAFSFALFSFAKLAKRFVPDDFASLAVLLLALTVTPFTETINGMEMNLYMLLALYLASLLLAEDRLSIAQWLLAGVLSCALLLTRFEAPYLLFFLYLGLALSSQRRTGLLLLSLADLLFFSVTEYWRHSTFGKWLPNTVYAKRWPPYTVLGLKHEVLSRVLATSEILIVLAFPLLFLGALWLAKKLLPKSGDHVTGAWSLSPLLVSMAIGAILLGLGMGQNWGHPGRMILAFLPFVLLALVSAYSFIARQNGLHAIRLIFVILLGQVSVWVFQAGVVARGSSVPYTYSAEVGLAAERVREILGEPTLSVFIPDVGGASLCCANLDVMDSALLANPTLAISGYAGTENFLKTQRPEVVETHDPWAGAGRFYDGQLLDGYGVVEVQGKYLFLRNDLYRRLLQRGYPELLADDRHSPCVTEAEATRLKPTDLLYIMLRAKCIVISKEHVHL